MQRDIIYTQNVPRARTARRLGYGARRLGRNIQTRLNRIRSARSYNEALEAAASQEVQADGVGRYRLHRRRGRGIRHSRRRNRGGYTNNSPTFSLGTWQFGSNNSVSGSGNATGGRGAYSSVNSLMTPGSAATIPMFSSVKDETGALHICRKEYIADIQASTDFELQSFLLNPGNSTLFPWLSQIAVNYEEYEFSGLIFSYRTVTSMLSTTSSQIGTIIAATDYNCTNTDFPNKVQMMEYDGAISTQINQDLTCGVECDPQKNALGGILYITQAQNVRDLDNVQDAKTYFLGKFELAVNGCQNPTGEIGELWVSYHVVLRKPRMYQAAGMATPYSAAQFDTMNASPYVKVIDSAGTSLPQETAVSDLFNATDINNIMQYNTALTGSYNAPQGWSYFGNRNIFQQYTNWTLSGNPGQSALAYRFPDTLGLGTYEAQVVCYGDTLIASGAEANASPTAEQSFYNQGLVNLIPCKIGCSSNITPISSTTSIPCWSNIEIVGVQNKTFTFRFSISASAINDNIENLGGTWILLPFVAALYQGLNHTNPQPPTTFYGLPYHVEAVIAQINPDIPAPGPLSLQWPVIPFAYNPPATLGNTQNVYVQNPYLNAQFQTPQPVQWTGQSVGISGTPAVQFISPQQVQFATPQNVQWSGQTVGLSGTPTVAVSGVAGVVDVTSTGGCNVLTSLGALRVTQIQGTDAPISIQCTDGSAMNGNGLGSAYITQGPI